MNLKLLKYLFSIYPRMSTRLAQISRSFLLKKALFEIRKNAYLPGGNILIDYNKNKQKSFETMIGKKLHYFNPNKMSFPLIYRPFLLLSSLFNQKYRQIFYAYIMYHSVKRVLSPESDLYFWNPYTTWHYCFSFLENRKSVYLHTCYYPLFMADFYYANSFIIKIYSLDNCDHQIVTPEHRFVDEDDPVNIYFTQLTSEPPAEKRLRDFTRYLLKKGNRRLKVYIHYLDRNKDLSSTDFADMVEVISRERSMENLSKNQLSFSADSSIGFELLSLGIDHYMFYTKPPNRPELNDYAQKSERFISLEEDFASICERLSV